MAKYCLKNWRPLQIPLQPTRSLNDSLMVSGTSCNRLIYGTILESNELMVDYQDNVSLNLPFCNLTDSKLNAMFGSWLYRRHDLDLYNLFQNPDKFDECDPHLMLTTPCSEYYSVHNFNKMLVNFEAKSFSILHCNIRSLPKNLSLLEEILCSLDYKVEILGITETKLREKSIAIVNIKGYNFYHNDSPTNAGGAALYITSNLNAIHVPRLDIKFNMKLGESCWAKIDAGKDKRKSFYS